MCQRCAVGAAGRFARGFARGAGVWGGLCGCIVVVVGFVGPEAWLLGVVVKILLCFTLSNSYFRHLLRARNAVRAAAGGWNR